MGDERRSDVTAAVHDPRVMVHEPAKWVARLRDTASPDDGVLLFRVLTYGIQIPIGGVTYLIWKEKRSWRRPVPSASVPDETLSEARP